MENNSNTENKYSAEDNAAYAAAEEAAKQNENVFAANDGPPYDIDYPVDVSIKNMMDAGAHFGHQSDRWNPKMLPNIYTKRNGIYIINLDKTVEQWKRARAAIVGMASRGAQFLFVGTKLQAREIVKFEAQRSGCFHVSARWLGGTLSNFQTIKNSIERMRKLEDLLVQAEQEGTKIKISKKEKLYLARELAKLESSLGGIRDMRKLPDALFIVDIVKEDIAVKEARKLRIPVFAIVDTNANPTLIEYPISANDDAARSVRLLTAAAADAVLEGKKAYEVKVQSSQFTRGKNSDSKVKAAATTEAVATEEKTSSPEASA